MSIQNESSILLHKKARKSILNIMINKYTSNQELILKHEGTDNNSKHELMLANIILEEKR